MRSVAVMAVSVVAMLLAGVLAFIASSDGTPQAMMVGMLASLAIGMVGMLGQAVFFALQGAEERLAKLEGRLLNLERSAVTAAGPASPGTRGCTPRSGS